MLKSTQQQNKHDLEEHNARPTMCSRYERFQKSMFQSVGVKKKEKSYFLHMSHVIIIIIINTITHLEC